MRKYFIINLLIILLFGASIHCNHLIDAVDNLNIHKLKRMLQKQEIIKEEKEKMLASIGQTIKIYKKSTKSLWSSKVDLFRFLFGLSCLTAGLPSTAIGGLGIFLATGRLLNQHISNASFEYYAANGGLILGIPLTLFGVGTSCLGINQARKGWNLFSAFNRLKKARKIEALIEKCSVKNTEQT